ncbi:hypothetical protein F5888DRAFT_1744925 [Russula emetica]|nr:hypothetical protein F5888DRAFT_1744925 [Russula emetica]
MLGMMVRWWLHALFGTLASCLCVVLPLTVSLLGLHTLRGACAARVLHYRESWVGQWKVTSAVSHIITLLTCCNTLS